RTRRNPAALYLHHILPPNTHTRHVVLGRIKLHATTRRFGQPGTLQRPAKRRATAMLVGAFALAVARYRKLSEFHPWIGAFIDAVPGHLRFTFLSVIEPARDDLPQPGHGLEVGRIGVSRFAHECGTQQHEKGHDTRDESAAP